MQSIKCRQSPSARLKLNIPPPGYMLLFAALMWFFTQLLPLLIWLASPWNQSGWIIIALSVIPAVGAFYLFGRKQTTANPFQPQKATTLVTNGVYRYSRNPMYLALLMLLTGWALYLGSLVAALFLPLFVLIINHQQIQWEELALEQRFEQEYLDYKTRVRRWL
ncbi:MAG: isoprenylcysteine carboxylmethyltransferase family protein [Candidatus Thiodiazotropha sp.]|jgi:protein-S-isoprenylcysteine O-methyltransferase Ste14